MIMGNQINVRLWISVNLLLNTHLSRKMMVIILKAASNKVVTIFNCRYRYLCFALARQILLLYAKGKGV